MAHDVAETESFPPLQLHSTVSIDKEQEAVVRTRNWSKIVYLIWHMGLLTAKVSFHSPAFISSWLCVPSVSCSFHSFPMKHPSILIELAPGYLLQPRLPGEYKYGKHSQVFLKLTCSFISCFCNMLLYPSATFYELILFPPLQELDFAMTNFVISHFIFIITPFCSLLRFCVDIVNRSVRPNSKSISKININVTPLLNCYPNVILNFPLMPHPISP